MKSCELLEVQQEISYYKNIASEIQVKIHSITNFGDTLEISNSLIKKK